MDQLQEWINQYRTVRAEKDSVAQTLKLLNEDLDKLEMRIVEAMQEAKLQSLKGEFGLISLVSRESFRVPKGEDEKRFRDWCMAQGEDTFTAIYSPQSQKYNSFFKADWENALSRGDVDYQFPPGVSEPSRSYTLSLRKS